MEDGQAGWMIGCMEAARAWDDKRAALRPSNSGAGNRLNDDQKTGGRPGAEGGGRGGR